MIDRCGCVTVCISRQKGCVCESERVSECVCVWVGVCAFVCMCVSIIDVGVSRVYV